MRPTGGLVRRNACVCTAQAGWNSLGSSARSKAYPPLTYSINRLDITGAELGMLLAASTSDAMDGRGAAPLCRQNYSYWRSPEGLHHATKLEVALRHSVAAVACFTTWNVYGESVAASTASGGGSGAEARCESGRGGGFLCYAADGQQASQPSRGVSRAQQQQRPAQRLAWHESEHLQREQQLQQQGSCEREWKHELNRIYSSTCRSADRGATTAEARTASTAPGLAATAEEAVVGTVSFLGAPGTLSPSAQLSPAPCCSSSCSCSSFSSSSSPSSSSSSSSSQSSAHPSFRSYGDKPSAPPGVPEMDWNWMLTPNRRDYSNSSSGSSSNSIDVIGNNSDGRNSGKSRDPVGQDAGWSSSTSSSSSAVAQRALWSWSKSFTSTTTSMSSSSSQSSRKHLVGFARATGDNSLVATIYDVAVHPAVRGQGIGSRLVKLLVQQIQARTVYDIGVVTPAEAFSFWERCAFDDDREGSTFMTFVGRQVGQCGGDDEPGWDEEEEAAHEEVGFGAPRNSQQLLDLSDLGYWDAASRSRSLQALLASKLQRMKEAQWGLATVAGAEAGMAGEGGKRGINPGDGRVRWGLHRPRDAVSGRSYFDK
ncbi:hypothetical protein Vafri_15875 [Volvox africanus]|uniref:N-acetyltransferase domain-containing protein n=1 Tax=Volvox africanus TaxID=51714 RepID=A0A8J4BIJ0_9CHLO|nr:hypothetical protein Vafri_15875 [Volvox africanus]